MEEPRRARVKRTLEHMSEYDGNIKYDKYTGEIQYDGVNDGYRRERTVVHTDIKEKEENSSQGMRSLYALIKGYGRTG